MLAAIKKQGMKYFSLILSLFYCLIGESQTAFVAAKFPSATPPPTVADSVLVNFYDGSTGTGRMHQPNWNNWTVAAISFGQTTTSPAFTDVHGTATAITGTFSIGQADNTANGFFIDNGAGYAAATTSNYPDTVFELAYLFTGGASSSSDTLTLNNLPTPSSGNYTIEVISSRSTATSRPQTWTVNGTTISLNAQNNFNNLTGGTVPLHWDNVPKDAGGHIKIIVNYTGQFCFFNAIKIKFIP